MHDLAIASADRNTNALPGEESPRHHILVVEDDDFIRQMNVACLLRGGYEVDAAADGSIAWEALSTRHYDLLLTDNHMPNFCGVALIQKLRSAGITLPVILASAMSEAEWKQVTALHLDAMLPKPYTLAELLHSVQHVLAFAEAKLETPLVA
ncbi:MAG TPA: response regulator [Candidatus Saccharimonadales bacterium]|nr:response regulator [Candidatus Saccharimonadales bacterium]